LYSTRLYHLSYLCVILGFVLSFCCVPTIQLFAQAQHKFHVKTGCGTKVNELLNACENTQNNAPLAAFDYAEQALNVAQLLDCKEGMYHAFVCLGNSLANLGDYEPAYKYYLQALTMQEKFLHNKREMALVNNDIATIFRYQKNPKKIIFYLDKALLLSIEANDSVALATTYNQMGRAYTLQKDWDLGLDYHQRALSIRLAIADSAGLLVSYNNVGFMLSKLKRYVEALVYYEKSLQINDIYANKEMRAGTLDNIGDVYLRLGRHQQALQYYEKSLAFAQQMGSKTRILECYESFVELWTLQKNYQKLAFYQQKYLDLKDSIFTSTQTEQMAHMEAIYNFEQQRRENEVLKNEKKIQEKEINAQKATVERQYIVIIAVTICFMFMGILAYVLYLYNRNKNIVNEQLKKLNEEILEQREAMMVQAAELNEANEEISQLNEGLEKTVQERTAILEATYRELDTFLYRTSHDFRRPLTALLGISQLAQITVDDVEALDLFDKVEQTSLEMDKMIRKLQTVSEVHLNLHEQKEQADFEKIIGKLQVKFKNLLDYNKISFQYQINLTKPCVVSEFFIANILENLVENSIFFYSRQNPFVRIEIGENAAQDLQIKVIDNGQGIAKELQPLIFDMYFRANEGSKGNGLGLYVVKNIIDKLKGSIEVESSFGNGATFIVTLPKE
jgi:signal transduction histidine kinase